MADLRSLLYFVVFVVGICLLLGGALGWVITADKDHSITYRYQSEDVPAGAQGQSLDVGTYEMLTAEQKADFQRAVDGEVVSYDTGEQVWPEAMERNGTYYVFDTASNFDWLNPMTFGPALVSLTGLLAVVQAARLEHRTY